MKQQQMNSSPLLDTKNMVESTVHLHGLRGAFPVSSETHSLKDEMHEQMTFSQISSKLTHLSSGSSL